MRDLTVGVFKHVEITSELCLYLRIKYTDHILMLPLLKCFDRTFQSVCSYKTGYLYINGIIGWWIFSPCNSSRLSPKWTDSPLRDTSSMEKSIMPPWEGFVVKVGKKHVEEKPNNISVSCQVHPQQHCEALQVRHYLLQWLRLWDTQSR